MNEVHAPYHFVPLSKWVYMPDWAHLVSHDVPFKDGLSGSIEFNLINKTPMCVGSEQDNQAESSIVNYAVNPKGVPVIPGSSVKGVLRSVLEIASFAKFSQFDDQHLSYRDISSSGSDYSKKMQDKEAVALWLKYDSKSRQWKMQECKHVALFHDEFNQAFGTEIKNISQEQSAEIKFAEYPLSKRAVSFDIAEREIEGTKGKNVKVLRAANLGKGKTLGQPIFSGFRPGAKKYTNARLNFSYLFYGMSNDYLPFNDSAELVNQLFNNHQKSLVDYLKANPHADFGIPVFGVKESNGSFLSLGFSKMPRVLYDSSIKDLVNKNQLAASSQLGFDLPELMFGTLRENSLSLKSRISFTDAVVQSDYDTFLSQPLVLGQPRASYLGTYLEQYKKDENNEVSSDSLAQYRDQDRLAGWKRYPVQEQFAERLHETLQDKTNIQSQLNLVSSGAEFKGRIQFHNLLPNELGALLWALSFGDSQLTGRYCHSIGHGRPLGAGVAFVNKISLSLTSYCRQDLTISKLMSNFEEHLNDAYPFDNKWLDSIQLQHLLAFSDHENSKGQKLDYMLLTNEDKKTESITYTSSMKGKIKQVQPNWNAATGSLSRKEPALTSYQLDKALKPLYQAGRLSHLLKSESLESRDKKFAKELLDEIDHEREAKISANLPEHIRRLHSLIKQLTPYFEDNSPVALDARRAKNSEIEGLLHLFINSVDDADNAKIFYELVNNKTKSAYLDLAKNKKNKVKLSERKELVRLFATKNQLA